MCKAGGGVGLPLSYFGTLDTCRGVMRAYAVYRYNLFKEKYEKYGRKN